LTDIPEKSALFFVCDRHKGGFSFQTEVSRIPRPDLLSEDPRQEGRAVFGKMKIFHYPVDADKVTGF
jgi:hypothetical protein